MKLTQAQIDAAHGQVFEAPRIIDGSSLVRFMGVWPTGNVGVKRARDDDSFGPVTVSPEKAKPLLDAIRRNYDRFGNRQT